MNPHISASGKYAANDSTPNSSGSKLDTERSYIRSLATSFAWAASGGKSGAAFSRTTDDRFVIKCISRTELQMFLDCAPAYFEVSQASSAHYFSPYTF
jgi:1-phosphatidylinositol-3-phosphate 5-kinase